jgi:DNA-binding transcriptional MerR regulator
MYLKALNLRYETQLGSRTRATHDIFDYTLTQSNGDQPMSASGAANYRLTEVCEMTGFTPRQIADLRSKGALTPPQGHGRSARYSDSHIDALRAVQNLSGAGISRKRIASHLVRQQDTTQPVPAAAGAVVTARWTRVTIDQQIEIAVMGGGSNDARNRALLDHLVQEAKRFVDKGSQTR